MQENNNFIEDSSWLKVYQYLFEDVTMNLLQNYRCSENELEIQGWRWTWPDDTGKCMTCVPQLSCVRSCATEPSALLLVRLVRPFDPGLHQRPERQHGLVNRLNSALT